MNHVKRKHGEKGLSDHSMKNDLDIARIKYVLDNYDGLKKSDKPGTRAYRNSDGTRAKTIVYQKAINGTYYIVEAVPNSKAKTLNPISAYISTKKEIPSVQMADTNVPAGTPEARPQSNETSIHSIVDSPIKSNPSSIGNSVFGPEIVKEILGFGENGNSQSTMGQVNEPTPSMKRADGGKTAEDWKSIAERINSEHKGIWRMKDFSRVLDQASGNDKGLRQQLYELYEKPLNEAQGSYAKKYAEKAKQITAKFSELGIKAKSNESAAPGAIYFHRTITRNVLSLKRTFCGIRSKPKKQLGTNNTKRVRKA